MSAPLWPSVTASCPQQQCAPEISRVLGKPPGRFFCGKEFREAVNYLLEFNGKRARDSPAPRPKPAQQEEKPAFVLPIANRDHRRVFAYLQKRGIAPQVIRGFIDSGLLYEDSLHHNCVFVGREVGGKAVFASKRGTYDLNGSGFKGDAVGSDKSVAFRLPCDPALDWVAVFEAPIDLMSFCTLHRAVTSNAVALCGLYQGPLDTYLRENPHLKRIVLCLDADGPASPPAMTPSTSGRTPTWTGARTRPSWPPVSGPPPATSPAAASISRPTLSPALSAAGW